MEQAEPRDLTVVPPSLLLGCYLLGSSPAM
jgi:hypothetical protein